MHLPTRSFVYKSIGNVSLRLHVFEPPHLREDDPRPAIVFFFGGGWSTGTPEQFYPQCAHLASLGMVAMSAEYRVATRHATTPRECVWDGRSCIRWIRRNAALLHIDPSRLAAGGGSAGGHIAATAALLPNIDEPGEDTTVSCRPNALVLFNPVLDNGPDGYGYDRIGDDYLQISPAHNLRNTPPPTLLMLGTRDDYIPVTTLERFAAAARALGGRCELLLYEEQVHGFFNYGDGRNPFYKQTLHATETFLRSNRFL